jgi:hypothetical protein
MDLSGEAVPGLVASGVLAVAFRDSDRRMPDMSETVLTQKRANYCRIG